MKQDFRVADSVVSFAPAALQDEALAVFGRSPVFPLIGIDKPGQFRDAVEGAIRGYEGSGYDPILEILMRDQKAIPAGIAEIRRLKEEYGDRIKIVLGSAVGADDVKIARSAGADGLVSGGYSRKVAEACAEAGLPYLSGLMTLAEMTAARDAGFKMIKLFPATPPVSYADLAAPLSRLNDIRIGDAENGRGTHVHTASEVLALKERGGTYAVLVPKDTSGEVEAMHRFLAQNGMIACCTGGVKPDNITAFAARASVSGVGATSFAKVDGTDDYVEAMSEKIGSALASFARGKRALEVTRAPEPAAE